MLNRFFPMKDIGMANKSMKNAHFPNASEMPLLIYYKHLTSFSKDPTQLECLHTVAGNLKECNRFGKQFGSLFRSYYLQASVVQTNCGIHVIEYCFSAVENNKI